MRVRDNGIGIDPLVLREGRAGHFGFLACASGPPESAVS